MFLTVYSGIFALENRPNSFMSWQGQQSKLLGIRLGTMWGILSRLQACSHGHNALGKIRPPLISYVAPNDVKMRDGRLSFVDSPVTSSLHIQTHT